MTDSMKHGDEVMSEMQTAVSLREYTTFHIGGVADYFVTVTSEGQLREAVRWAREKKLPVTILGGGSNVFASDDGVRGLVIHILITGRTVKEEGDEILLTVGAGEVFDEVVADTVSKGWWGLENLSCIPGSVGATPIQNIGAYGVEIEERIASVNVYDTESDVSVAFASAECGFGYRDSRFKHADGKRYIVTAVTYRLGRTPNPVLHYRDLTLWNESRTDAPPTLAEIRDAVCAIRAQKFPDWRVMGTAGSFFKNPTISAQEYATLIAKYPLLPGHAIGDGTVKIPLGWILDQVLSLRGHREGTVGTYEGQALVVVNHGNATATELEAFVQKIAHAVLEKTGITIEWEVTKLS